MLDGMNLAALQAENERLTQLDHASQAIYEAMLMRNAALVSLLREPELSSDEHGAYIGVLCRPADWIERRNALLTKNPE